MTGMKGSRIVVSLHLVILLFSFHPLFSSAQNSELNAGGILPDGLFKKWYFIPNREINTAKGERNASFFPGDTILFIRDSAAGIQRFVFFTNGKKETGWLQSKDSLCFLISDFQVPAINDSSLNRLTDDSLPGDEVNEVTVKTRYKTFRLVECGNDTLYLNIDSADFYYTSGINKIVNQGVKIKGVSSAGSIKDVTFHSVWRGLIGIITLLIILFIFSNNRRAISWKLVISGITLQLLFAVCVLYIPVFKTIFEVAGNFFVIILSFTKTGAEFVFGKLVHNSDAIGFVFAFQILPTILFFSALTSVLFYLGVLQRIVYGIAWVMSRTMKMSGAESLSAAANIFIGQTEAPLLIKPYIGNMTRSEILCVMIGGMATIAGGVMAAYIGFLGGDDPARQLFFAKHLLCASVMSAPAAVVAAKILFPQTEKIDTQIKISQEKIGKNFLEAIANGTYDGMRLAVNVGAMLIVFIALVAMVNYFLKDVIGSYTDLNRQIVDATNGRYDGLSLQFLLGLGCAPLSWLLGVCSDDMVLVGQLIGEKTILNEFVAYTTLGKMEFANVFKEEKSIIIATYILCGFSNFASIGIQIGGIGALAPNRKTTLSELGIMALIGGTVASLLTATIVGILM